MRSRNVPVCDCRPEVNSLRLTSSSDGETCDYCGYYVTWVPKTGKVRKKLERVRQPEEDMLEYEISIPGFEVRIR